MKGETEREPKKEKKGGTKSENCGRKKRVNAVRLITKTIQNPPTMSTLMYETMIYIENIVHFCRRFVNIISPARGHGMASQKMLNVYYI